MALSTGQNNLLLGYQTVIPNPNGSNQIVLGSPINTIYMGGATGVTANSGTLNMGPQVQISLSGSIGNYGQVVMSNGAGQTPYWGPPIPQTPIPNIGGTYGSLTIPLSALYLFNSNQAWTQPLPNPALAPNTAVWFKSMSAFTGTITGNLILSGQTVSSNSITMQSGDSCLFESDSNYWYVLSSM